MKRTRVSGKSDLFRWLFANWICLVLLTPTALYPCGREFPMAIRGISWNHPSIVLRQLEVVIASPFQIDLKYLLANLDKKPQQTTLQLFLPPQLCGTVSRFRPTQTPQWSMGGKALVTQEKIIAVENKKNTGPLPPGTGKNISAQVLAAGLPLDCTSVRSNSDLFAKAQTVHLARIAEKDKTLQILYQTDREVSASVELAANSELEVVVSYHPVIEESYSGLPPYYDDLTWTPPMGKIPLTPQQKKAKKEKKQKKEERLEVKAQDAIRTYSALALDGDGLVTAGKIPKFSLVAKGVSEFFGTNLPGAGNGVVKNNEYQYHADNFQVSGTIFLVYGQN